MHKDATTVDMLKNNAKTMGGVIGMEEAFFERNQEDIPDAAEFFHEASDLDVHNITFK